MSIRVNKFQDDQVCIRRAVELALAAEDRGNLPVGALVTFGGKIIAEGANRMLTPAFHPGKHAEPEALRAVPDDLWERAAEMTCYTTLEPCTMCMGTLLVHGIGRVVFGSSDELGGGSCLLPHLPRFFENQGRMFELQGPILPELCDPLAKRVISHFL